MAEDTDGMEEAFAGQIRVIVTAAGLAGEGLARAREQQQRRAQAASEQEAHELQSRLAAKQQAARAELSTVYRAEWWDRATPEQIGHSYQVAHAWARDDPDAAKAEHHINDELRRRYGIEVTNTNVDPAAVRAAMERAEQDRARSAAERSDAATDLAEAQLLLNQANVLDRHAENARQAAEHEPDPDVRAAALAEPDGRGVGADARQDTGHAVYDSAERRDASARDLEEHGVEQKAVAAKMYADVSQAKPATEAAVQGHGRIRGVKARRSRSRNAQVQRPGAER